MWLTGRRGRSGGKLRRLEKTKESVDQKEDRPACDKDRLPYGRNQKIWTAAEKARNEHLSRNTKRDDSQLAQRSASIAYVHAEENLCAPSGGEKPMTFSESSYARLKTCHPDLIRLFERVLQIHNCTVVCGHRNEADQSEAVRTGNSKTPWPESKHNSNPSMAVDVVPFPILWDEPKRFIYFAGIVKGVAASMNIRIRWGGDWDNDNDMKDQSFMDFPHFELIE